MNEHKEFLFRLLVSTAIFSSAIFPSPAQSQTVYTWHDAVKEAAVHHPDLTAAREDIRQSEADTSIAAAGFLPQVDAHENDPPRVFGSIPLKR